MASAASGFVLSLNVAAAAATTNSSSSPSRVIFPSKNNVSRLVVRASDEAAPAPATATPPPEAEAKPKPPPIGPKRGAKVSYPPQFNSLSTFQHSSTIGFITLKTDEVIELVPEKCFLFSTSLCNLVQLSRPLVYRCSFLLKIYMVRRGIL